MWDFTSAQWAHLPQPNTESLQLHLQNKALFGASHPVYLITGTNIKGKMQVILHNIRETLKGKNNEQKWPEPLEKTIKQNV